MYKSKLFVLSLVLVMLLSACASATTGAGTSGTATAVLPTQAETTAPTQAATTVPTQVPTTAATQAPTTAPTQAATLLPTQAATPSISQTPVIPSTGGIDWTQHGFSTVLATQQITSGQAITVTAGPYSLQVPANAFTQTVTVEVLQGNPADFQTNAPSGETPVLAFALSVTDAQGAFIPKFNHPITLTVMSSSITADSKYYNIAPDGTYADNPTGLQVQAGQLTHPIGADSVAWVITAPSASSAATPTPAAQGGYSLQVSNNPSLGNILVNDQGMTLYTFKKDTAGVSNCNGGCATLWPPLTVANGATPTAAPGITGKLGVITRSDGSQQVTYNGMPLYTYAGDKKAGDTTGQGFGNLWYVVPANPSSSSGSGSTSGGNGGY